MTEPINIFISYSHQDAPLHDELVTHLALMRRQGIVSAWHDRQIEPGADWRERTHEQLERAQVFLLLVSSDFLASDYCYGVELSHAIKRLETGRTLLLPIILRPCELTGAPFSGCSLLPRGGKPITTWRNRDEAWQDVVQGIRDAISSLDTLHTGGAQFAHRPALSVVHTSKTADGILLSMLPSDPYGLDADSADVPTRANASVTLHCPSARYLSQPLHHLAFTPVAALCLASTGEFVKRLETHLGQHIELLGHDPVDLRPQERSVVAAAIGLALSSGFTVAIAIPKFALAVGGNLKLKYQTIANAIVLPLLSAHRSWGATGMHLRVGQRGERDRSLLHIMKSAVRAVFPKGRADFVEDPPDFPCTLARTARFVAWAVGRYYNEKDDRTLRAIQRSEEVSPLG